MRGFHRRQGGRRGGVGAWGRGLCCALLVGSCGWRRRGGAVAVGAPRPRGQSPQRAPQKAPPKAPQRPFKGPPNGPQRGPKRPPNGPQTAPKRPPKGPQTAPKRPPNAPKRGPKRPPKGPPNGPQRPQRGPTAPPLTGGYLPAVHECLVPLGGLGGRERVGLGVGGVLVWWLGACWFWGLENGFGLWGVLVWEVGGVLV